MHPTKYQREAMTSSARRKVYLWGRQSGKTMTAAIEALWTALFHKDHTVLIVSSSLNQAQELIRHVKTFLTQYISTHPGLPSNLITRETSDELWFNNSSRILVRPGTANIRGYKAHLLIIDEAAQVPDELITQSAPPVLSTTRGRMILISTPHSIGTAFDEACRNRRVYKVFGPVPTSANPYHDPQYLADAKESMPEDFFKQEHLAIQVSEMSNVFAMEHVDAAVFKGEPPAQEVTYVGVDLAKTTDWTVFLALYPTGHVVAMEEYKRLAYPDVVDRLKSFCLRNKTARLVVDQTGMGEAVLDQIHRDFRGCGMSTIIDGIVLTYQHKTDVINNLKTLIEQRRVLIPPSGRSPQARKLYQQLLWYRYEKLDKSGLLRTTAPEGKHDDYVIALAAWSLRPMTTVTTLRGLEGF